MIIFTNSIVKMKFYRTVIVFFKILIGILLLPIGLNSCNSGNNITDMEKLQAENDSLQLYAEKSKQYINDMNSYFSSISECLDSISEQENLLLLSVNPETNKRYSKEEINQRLNLLSEILTRQRDKIRSLSDSLGMRRDTIATEGLSKMVKYLTSQLENRENQIQTLKKEITENKRNINLLKSNIKDLNTELSSVNEQNKSLSNAVVAQTQIINEGYVLMGDKKKLQQMGVMTKGSIFKKSQFDANRINLSECQSVDISKATQIPLYSKKPKVLTANPTDSYRIEDRGDIKILIINNPNKFWSLSNILVIQL